MSCHLSLMRVAFLGVALVFSPSFVWAKTYGAPLKAKTDQLSLDRAISQKRFDQLIEVKGSVSKVCQKKGCWMELQDGKRSVRVTFKDYGFFVPKDLGGKNIRAQGNLIKKEQPVSEQIHYFEDEGKKLSEKEKKSLEPKITYQFIASGVQIQ